MVTALPNVKVITADGTERYLYGTAAALVLLVLSAANDVESHDKGEIALHWAGQKATGKVTTALVPAA